MVTIHELVQQVDAWLWGWPLLIFVIGAGIAITIALNFVQFRYFFRSWVYVFVPERTGASTENYITPIQAFLTILNSSIGNGSAAGMATAVAGGGPGAALWVAVFGIFYLAIRYAEVYASAAITQKSTDGIIRGGPMVYLQHVPGGRILPSIYAFFALGLSIVAGNAMQCNSITLGVERVTGMSPYPIALVLFLLLVYIMLGGSKRIIRFSETIVPIKVALFFIMTLVVLIYNYAGLWDALQLIVRYALTPQAMAGGAVGFTVQHAISYGMSRSLNATEVGLGVAGILYGSARQTDPVRSGIMSMATACITSYLVCFTLMLVLIVTGVWNSGLQSTQLTMAAYETVFGALGGILVAVLSIAFGLGVLVTYGFIGRECWRYLLRGRLSGVYTVLYCCMALFGSLSRVDLIWNATGIVNAGLIIINIYALVYLLPMISAGLKRWEKEARH